MSEMSEMSDYQTTGGREAGMSVKETPPQVAQALSSLEQDARNLLEAVDALERRLADVLRPIDEGPDRIMLAEPRPPQVPLAEQIGNMNGLVRLAWNKVAVLNDRLEL